MEPDVRYARNGEVSIAYRVVGRGERDLVLVPDRGGAGWAVLESVERPRLSRPPGDSPGASRFRHRRRSKSAPPATRDRGSGAGYASIAGAWP